MPIRFTEELLKNTFFGPPPKGCRYCDRGTKLVIYITGLCNQNCFYCPLSEEKRGRDVIFANEARVEKIDEIVEEAKKMRALGAGITGGDPLIKVERVERVIKRLKEEFGKRFHIHLYNAGIFPHEHFKRAVDAGLDEIRFHPPVEIWEDFDPRGEGYPGRAKKYIEMIKGVKEMGVDTGIEVPAIPGEERGLRALVEFAREMGLLFVNINELELSHTNADELLKRGLYPEEDSAAIEGSRETAYQVIESAMKDWSGNGRVPVLHFCSAYFKDAVQLRKRLKRTAENVAREFEVVSEDGTLLLGLIEGIEERDAKRLVEEYEIPRRFYHIDARRRRMEIGAWILEDIAGEIPYKAYLIERYPTADALEVERIPLN
ncbi:MAG: radical SAM protein [Thermoplasmata archaeon]|nr:radical SAM protein [Thermoplasmata archaeon]